MSEVLAESPVNFYHFRFPGAFSFNYQYQFADGSLRPDVYPQLSEPFDFDTGSVLWDDTSFRYQDDSAFLYTGNSGLTVDGFGNPNGGTLTGILSLTYARSAFYVLGFSLDATGIGLAALTRGNEDDKGFLKRMLKGNDTVTLKGGSDYVWTSTGHDTVSGGRGHDSLFGNTGHDKLFGQGDNDLVSGGAGNDTLSGGWGADTLQGGGGTDRLDAGDDRSVDVIIFNTARESGVGESRDSIGHFMRGTDEIDLHLIDANASQSGNQTFGFSGTTARGYSVWYAKTTGGIIVKVDRTGDTTADLEIRIDGLNGISAGDFLP